MSRRGNCYDNAAMESFWSTLKLELVYRGRFTSHRHAKSEILDFIEVFYNRQRRLVRNYETSTASAEAFVLLATIRIQVRRSA